MMVNHLVRRLLSPPKRALVRLASSDIAGSGARAIALAHHRARWRRQWVYDPHAPHFTDFHAVMTEIAYGNQSAEGLTRAFLAADVLRSNDHVLDIGCGDGFAARRFLSPQAAHVDGIDIEPDAIARARRIHAAPNVTYWLRNAVAEPFPTPPYDLIVWDGAIGHFPPETVALMVAKIRDALTSDGVFVGSESLGRAEGAHDHLRFFDNLDDLAKLLGDVFPAVAVRESQYEIGGGFLRREGYWRAALTPDRLNPWSTPS